MQMDELGAQLKVGEHIVVSLLKAPSYML